MPNPASPSTYWVLEAELPPDAEELWSWHCFRCGARGSEWREESPGRLRIAYFFDQLEQRDAGLWLKAFRESYPGAAPPGRIGITEQLRQPWDTAWHAQFGPVPAGRGLMVCPPWNIVTAESSGGRRPLIIEPGQGFGTGRHASTLLAIELIEDALPPREGARRAPSCLVDIGTGSGILAIAARLLGVPRAIAIDIERAAVLEARHNFALNGLTPPLCVQGGPASLRGRYPLVVANLVMPLLDLVADDLAALTAPGGSLIVSGVLESERERLLPSYLARGCEPLDSRAREGWIAFHLRRSA